MGRITTPAALGAGIGDDFIWRSSATAQGHHRWPTSRLCSTSGTPPLTFFFRFMAPLPATLTPPAPPLFKSAAARPPAWPSPRRSGTPSPPQLPGDNPNAARWTSPGLQGAGVRIRTPMSCGNHHGPGAAHPSASSHGAAPADQTCHLHGGSCKEFIERNAKYAVNLDY